MPELDKDVLDVLRSIDGRLREIGSDLALLARGGAVVKCAVTDPTSVKLPAGPPRTTA